LTAIFFIVILCHQLFGGDKMRKFLITSLLVLVSLPAFAGAKRTKWKNEVEKANLADARHKQVMEVCGHDVKVKIDWPSFNLDDWAYTPKGDGSSGYTWTADEFLTHCADSTFRAIYDFCKDEDMKDYKLAAQKIKTITCHFKACKSLPPRDTDNPKIPGFEYKLSKDKSNFDVSFCKESQVYEGLPTAMWPKKYLKEKL
jgi:hypothetical protein